MYYSNFMWPIRRNAGIWISFIMSQFIQQFVEFVQFLDIENVHCTYLSARKIDGVICKVWRIEIGSLYRNNLKINWEQFGNLELLRKLDKSRCVYYFFLTIEIFWTHRNIEVIYRIFFSIPLLWQVRCSVVIFIEKASYFKK